MRFLFDILINKFIYRPYLLRRLGSVGDNFRFGFMSEINNPELFFIGNNFYSGPFCLFSTNKNNPVYIENNVMFGPKCNIQGGNHDFYFHGFMRLNNNVSERCSKIEIEKGAWIGTNTTLVSGASVGEGSIIGAMSLVNKRIPPFVVAAGVPAQVIKPRFSNLADLERALGETGSKYSLSDVLRFYRSVGVDCQFAQNKDTAD